MDTQVLAFDLPRQVVFSGAVTGVTYAVMAVSIILIFRSTRVINFAIGQMGGFAAALLYRMVIDWNVPFWISFVACIIVGALLGAGIELLVVRRLFTAPRVIMLVALIGMAQLLLFFQVILPEVTQIRPYPTPWSDRWVIADVVVRSEELLVLIVMPVLVVALAYFLNRTKYGLAVRASAANADAARLAGINIKTMSTVVWILAGSLTSIGALLFAPLSPNSSTIISFGPGLLLRVLAVALIVRMASLPGAIFAGIAIGVAESAVTFNWSNQRGLLDLILFLIVGAVLFTRRNSLAEADSGRWSFAPRIRPIPSALEEVWWVRRLPLAGGLVVAIVALAPLTIFDLPSQQHAWTRVVLFAMVALSLTVLTGWAGQLSLGQFAFVGIGGMTSAVLVREGLGFVPAIILGASVAALVAIVIGISALRRPGLFLAVVTFALAVATPSWLLWRDVFLKGDRGAELPRQLLPLPEFLFDEGWDLDANGSYYALCVALLIVAIVAVAWLQRSRLGRSMIAVRDNERAAASFGISPARIKLIAFGIGGWLAGLAGGLLVGLLTETTPGDFPAADSLRVISIVVIGGLSSVAGAVLGAVFVVGLPVLFDDSPEVGLLTSGAGLLILILYFPGGLIQVLYSTRDAALGVVARRRPEPPERPVEQLPVPTSLTVRQHELPAHLDTVIATHDVTVTYGKRVVVDHVRVTLGRSEIVGLIGTNGAGKTTLMNAICGVVPSRGGVEILGERVDRRSTARRARLGLGRTWQGAELFQDLTVRETVGLAVRGVRPWERKVRAEADEVIAFLGLGTYVDKFINELSTGTRRIVELGCLLASGSRVLCLDEPTAGIAQRETEAFGPLILRIKEEIDASILVIEHDMPLVLGISDRVYCMEAGSIIAAGDPETIRNDPLVIASYLGTDENAIRRSGVRQGVEAGE